jgi:hypothetical protein
MRYFIFFALILCTVSCSHRSSYPVGGDCERTSDSFAPVYVLIPNAVDADITSVINGPGTGDWWRPYKSSSIFMGVSYY